MNLFFKVAHGDWRVATQLVPSRSFHVLNYGALSNVAFTPRIETKVDRLSQNGWVTYSNNLSLFLLANAQQIVLGNRIHLNSNMRVQVWRDAMRRREC
jgi:hypothetical protein